MKQFSAWPDRRATLAYVALLCAIGGVVGAQESGGNGASITVDEPTVDVNTVQIQPRPDLEFVLPYGVVRQKAEITLGRAVVDTEAEFDVPESAVSGELGLRRRFGAFEPRLGVYQKSAAESLAEPRVTGGEIAIAPDESYFLRERGLDARLVYFIDQRLHLELGTTLAESIETSRSDGNGDPIDRERFGIGHSVAAEITSLRIPRPRDSATLRGTYARGSLTQRFDGSWERPVSLNARLGTLWHHEPLDRLSLEHQISFDTPLYIWDADRFGPLVLGGYDTVRGHSSRSLSQIRGLALRNTLGWNADPQMEVTVESPQRGDDTPIPVRLHTLEALVAFDAALGQRRIDPLSAPVLRAGAGPGVSITISAAQAVHLELRSFVVWPIAESAVPQFYIQGSIFAVSGN